MQYNCHVSMHLRILLISMIPIPYKAAIRGTSLDSFSLAPILLQSHYREVLEYYAQYSIENPYRRYGRHDLIQSQSSRQH